MRIDTQLAAPADAAGEAAHVRVEGLGVACRTGPSSERTVLHDIGFALQRGETLGIVGESGCGKSTLARALMGHVRPGARVAAGRIVVGGHEVLRLSGTRLRRYRGRTAALVPQNPLSSLTPHMTVLAQLCELIRLHDGAGGRAAADRAVALLDATGLPQPSQLARRYPHELSGGQRQRVVIAAALAGTPELMVLDEPTTALDKTVEAQVLDLVSEVQARLGTTLIYVSHDLNVISRMCRRVLVMREGRVVEGGTTAQVFARPATDYARQLVGAIPRLEAARRPAPPPGPPILEVRDLEFRHAAAGSRLTDRLLRRPPVAPTLQGIAFDLPRGGTLGIVGESGSGKSTLAGLVAGALAGHRGTIRFDGAALSGLARRRPADLRRRVQMVFQDPLSSLNPRHSVEELIGRPLRLFFGMTRAAARARVLELLAELELSADLLGRYPQQLSGGQQQRIAIARAFACDPDLLICDEITSALDVTVQAQVIAMMQRLQRDRGTSYVFISHDLPVVAQLSDRILVLRGGRIMDLCTPAELIGGGGSAYSRGLIAAFQANARSTGCAEPRMSAHVT